MVTYFYEFPEQRASARKTVSFLIHAITYRPVMITMLLLL
jgi:hypothetical protein